MELGFTGVSGEKVREMKEVCAANTALRKAAKQAGASFDRAYLGQLATRLGEADKALPMGTRLRIEGLGDGTYIRFESRWVGANEHHIRLDSGIVRKLKLQDVMWSVIIPEPEPEPEPELPEPVEQAAAEEAPELKQCLEACGLGKYVAVMKANHITFDMLPQLDDTTLAMVGLTADEMVVLRQVRLRAAMCLG